MNTKQLDYSIMALDYGNARVGVAIGHVVARIPSPFGALTSDDSLLDELSAIIAANNVQQLVVGMPYAPRGGDTDQTALVRDFVTRLRVRFSIPLAIVDETLSSVQAEKLFGNKRVEKGMIDAYAAAIILQRYFDGETGESK